MYEINKVLYNGIFLSIVLYGMTRPEILKNDFSHFVNFATFVDIFYKHAVLRKNYIADKYSTDTPSVRKTSLSSAHCFRVYSNRCELHTDTNSVWLGV